MGLNFILLKLEDLPSFSFPPPHSLLVLENIQKKEYAMFINSEGFKSLTIDEH